MEKMNIVDIFPTPVYFCNLGNILNKEQNDFIKDQQLMTKKSHGNNISLNNFVLENINLSSLKNNIYIHVNEYFKKVYCTTKAIPYITQSWLNFTKEQEFHHEHYHSNSLISGVYYVNVDPDHDSIKFFKDRNYDSFKIDPDDWNIYNCHHINLKIKNNDLVLFPSFLTHSVEVKKENNLRISLAFNVFVKGELGKKENLNYLEL
jgi:uncharacterized protein (TIGR02466 family)